MTYLLQINARWPRWLRRDHINRWSTWPVADSLEVLAIVVVIVKRGSYRPRKFSAALRFWAEIC